MSEHKLKNEAVHYERLKQCLLDEYPDLVDDEEALADTLDGATNLHELIAAVCRSSQEDEAAVDGLKPYISKLEGRKARLDKRAKRKRDLVLQIMQDSGLSKVEAPDLTVSQRKPPPKPVVTDLDALPDAFVKVVRKPLLAEIKDALKANGTPPPGVTLDNGGASLTIRNT